MIRSASESDGSAVPFLDANTLNEYSSVAQDVVWLAAAFEQLLGITSRRKAPAVAQALRAYLSPYVDLEGERLIRNWAEEFYLRRNEMHGKPSERVTWPTFSHALIGTIAYLIVVKLLLADESRYALSDADKADASALPGWIDCVRADGMDEKGSDETAQCWHRARTEATFAAAFAAAQALINEEAQSE